MDVVAYILHLSINEATGEMVVQTLTPPPNSQDRRSLAETQMVRYKQIMGGTLARPDLANQQTESKAPTNAVGLCPDQSAAVPR